MDSDLSGGLRYQSFEQLGPVLYLCLIQFSTKLATMLRLITLVEEKSMG